LKPQQGNQNTKKGGVEFLSAGASIWHAKNGVRGGEGNPFFNEKPFFSTGETGGEREKKRIHSKGLGGEPDVLI